MDFKLIMQLSRSSRNISQKLFLHHFNTDLKHLYHTLHAMCIWCLPPYFDSSRQVENLANLSDKILEPDQHKDKNVDVTQMLMLTTKINHQMCQNSSNIKNQTSQAALKNRLDCFAMWGKNFCTLINLQILINLHPFIPSYTLFSFIRRDTNSNQDYLNIILIGNFLSN